MSKKRKTRAKHGRRAFLKALPSVGAAFKWTADKLGGAVLGVLLAEARRFFARPGEPTTAKRDTVVVLEPARLHWIGMEVRVSDAMRMEVHVSVAEIG